MQFDKLALATTSSVKGATAEFNFKELDLNRDSFVTSAELYFFTQLAVMMANRDSGDDLLS
ncbi:hypothetical protein T492DRAFT_1043005 [Pavlovales sp. CCMP2436]|nr:hypothetical protein T492DRAFT_1043005 [Pavlovales sp. CCMP2436]